VKARWLAIEYGEDEWLEAPVASRAMRMAFELDAVVCRRIQHVGSGN